MHGGSGCAASLRAPPCVAHTPHHTPPHLRAGSCPYGDRCIYSHAAVSAEQREALLQAHQQEQRQAQEQRAAEAAQQEAQRREAALLLTPLEEDLLALYELKLPA